jgi:hypothetical protein
VCRDLVGITEVEETFQGFRGRKSQEGQWFFTHSSYQSKECKSRGKLSRFHSLEAQERQHFKNLSETKVVGLEKEVKAKTFDTSEIF